MLQSILNNALCGIGATVDEAMQLNDHYTADELADAADRVRQKWCGDIVDTCSIVNARSGRCTEDCKWCAQSRHHATGINEYDRVTDDDAMHAAQLNKANNVRRYSLVTSGRKVAPADIDGFCDLYRKIGADTGLYLCASMGLLTRNELQKLKDAGVRRYHCNLETSASHFTSLCSTHSHEDKLRTIAWAREVGLEVCCGGIIGMGETMRQRLELADEARSTGAVSIPINILNPIKGTPLQDVPLISEDEITRTVALFRLMCPTLTLRFAGGRMRLSPQAMRRIMRGGMNGVLVGDMLTTIGNTLAEDRQLFSDTGFTQ